MGRLEFTDPREAWGGEASAFTPLLAEEDMLEYLGDETGIGSISLIEVEHTTAGNRSLDILAETSTGDRVAIENQYNVADHDHLTRGLAYAVAAGCRILVLVAEGHRDEFVSVADYLNDVALRDPERGILVWLVKVRAVRRIGDSVWSPEFVVSAEPNEWEASVRRNVPAKMQSLDDYYSKCISPEWAESARSMIERWIQIPGGREAHNSVETVALYLPTPRSNDIGTNVIQLRIDGRVSICRGYIWQNTGAFDPEEAPDELDDKIREHFPTARWVGKHSYIGVGHELDNFWSFADWLANRLTRVPGPAAE